MVANQRVTGRAWSMAGAVGMGLLSSLALTAAGCAAGAAMLEAGTMTQDAVGYGALAILLAASFLGSVTAVALCKRRRLPVCLACGAVYYLSLLLINGLLFGGGVSGTVVTALVILAGCLCAALLSGQGRGFSGGKRRNMVKLYKNPGAGK